MGHPTGTLQLLTGWAEMSSHAKTLQEERSCRACPLPVRLCLHQPHDGTVWLQPNTPTRQEKPASQLRIKFKNHQLWLPFLKVCPCYPFCPQTPAEGRCHHCPSPGTSATLPGPTHPPPWAHFPSHLNPNFHPVSSFPTCLMVTELAAASGSSSLPCSAFTSILTRPFPVPALHAQ